MDPERLEQFKVTKQVYDEMPQTKEFLIPTRNEFPVARYLDDNKLMKDVKILPYSHERGFNPSMALNIGVRNAKYSNIIITSPEVKPITDVLAQLSECLDKNVVCEVTDQAENGNLTLLVNSTYRNDSPFMYFLAMYQKKDIEAINGWDEDFMLGYAYEDNDFGERWKRAGLPYEFRDEIKAVHQYHPRKETIRGGQATNMQHFHDNNDAGVTYCSNGLIK
jgi:GT2 family glycosyltransferase